MKNKSPKNRVIIGGAIAAAALVVCSLVCFILADAGVFGVNPFQLTFAVLTLGAGAVLLVYGIISKGGYEFAIGGISLTIGLIIAFIGVLKWYLILAIALAALTLTLIGLFALKSKELVVERTERKEKEE
ncbi:MAG: hypothetical protein IJ800_05360 [Clostridia bacterium]|nr:hypothetical protein [Clostridia bacterium]